MRYPAASGHLGASMNRTARLLSTAGLALCLAGTVQPLMAAQPQDHGPPVVAQDLKQLRIGEISAVLWTRRADRYTLQVIMAQPGERTGTRISAALRPPTANSVTAPLVWLLAAEGKVLAPAAALQTPQDGKCTLRCLGDEYLYSFPTAAAQEAVAVAIQHNGEHRIEKLEKFAD